MRETLLRQFTSRCNRALFLSQLSRLLVPFLFGVGTVILLIRYTVPALFLPSLGLLGFSLLCVSIAARRSREQAYSTADALSWLESKTGGRGLLWIEDGGDWQKTAEALVKETAPLAPELRWSHWLKQWIPAAAFVALVCLLRIEPYQFQSVDAQLTVNSALLEEIRHDYEMIKDSGLLDEEEQAQLEEEMDKLFAEAKDNALTASYWEGVDTLQEQLQARAERAAQAVEGGMSSVQRAGEKAGSDMDAADAAEAQQEIERALAQLGAEGLDQNLSDELREKLQNMQGMTPEQLANAGADLAEALGELQDALGELQECLGELCEGVPGDGDGAGPGTGEATRGRGDAAISFGEESREDGVEFTPTQINNKNLDVTNTELQGIGLISPEGDTVEGPSGAGPGREFKVVNGKTVWKQKLTASRRSVIQDYFNGE